jgi:hypothetical protein
MAKVAGLMTMAGLLLAGCQTNPPEHPALRPTSDPRTGTGLQVSPTGTTVIKVPSTRRIRVSAAADPWARLITACHDSGDPRCRYALARTAASLWLAYPPPASATKPLTADEVKQLSAHVQALGKPEDDTGDDKVKDKIVDQIKDMLVEKATEALQMSKEYAPFLVKALEVVLVQAPSPRVPEQTEVDLSKMSDEELDAEDAQIDATEKLLEEIEQSPNDDTAKAAKEVRKAMDTKRRLVQQARDNRKHPPVAPATPPAPASPSAPARPTRSDGPNIQAPDRPSHPNAPAAPEPAPAPQAPPRAPEPVSPPVRNEPPPSPPPPPPQRPPEPTVPITITDGRGAGGSGGGGSSSGGDAGGPRHTAGGAADAGDGRGNGGGSIIASVGTGGVAATCVVPIDGSKWKVCFEDAKGRPVFVVPNKP